MRRHSAWFYLDGDLKLVQGADVLHQHCNDELMRHTLQNINTQTEQSFYLEYLLYLYLKFNLIK